MLTEEKNNKPEQIVVSWLRSHGYFRIIQEAESDEFKLIQADSGMRRISVVIKSSEIEKKLEEIKQLAFSMHREPWVAEIHDNDITWSSIK